VLEAFFSNPIHPFALAPFRFSLLNGVSNTNRKPAERA